ncbi:hypothetical protein [Kosakonia sp.]|uniref:hypothetical protein n=1 Tax=Kosakonia sp. TaxID=1916651 RepID=UPI0028A5CC8D|nr:hypothetical protein [Kosakonia sp.]
MKLINELKAQLATLGEIKRVWLTSFNINISFIETHLLPAVLGLEEPPKNRSEFERLQFDLTRKKIDFRIYCDKRLITQEQHKRTSIAVLPVSVRQIAPHLDARNSLFHPKVLYIEDIHGDIILGAGSANLTLSGWGRNQEAVDFRRVSTNKQYQQIKSFFTLVDPNIVVDDAFPVRRKFSHDDPDWDFIHSLSGPSLLKALANGDSVKKLSVWSPYLAADLGGFITSLSQALGNLALKVDLVPDLLQGLYLRTPGGENVEALRASNRLLLCENPIARDERSELTHAKIWLATGKTSARLAIGSWNFTAPGCSSLTVGKQSSHWNIEAGIVHSVAPKTTIVGEPLNKDVGFASAVLLEEERLPDFEQLPFDLQVQFDWRSARYRVSGEWFDGKPSEQYSLRLPGLSQGVPLRWRGKSLVALRDLVADQPDEVLTQHFYTVIRPGEADWQGIIHEVGQAFRRVTGFDSLHDLLNSYISDVDPQDNDAVHLRETLRDGDSAEDAPPEEKPQVQTSATSYFRLFYALEKRREQLEALNDDASLHYWLFTCPGCLLELVEKVREHLAAQPGTLFGWFMANEVQSLCQLAKKRYRKKSLAAHAWPKLVIDIPPLPVKGKQRQQYLDAIKQRCGYEA